MIVKKIDPRTVSIQGPGVIAVVTADNPYRWALLFAHAADLLAVLKALLNEAETVLELDGFTPEDFHTVRAAQKAIAAAERG